MLIFEKDVYIKKYRTDLKNTDSLTTEKVLV